jgi:hypothetical protein
MFNPAAAKSSNFTLAAYVSLIEKTAVEYPCRGFDVLASASLPDRFCLLRHDIDMAPKTALRLALLEAERDLRATYNVLLTGPHYSPFEKPIADIIRQIAELGHDIGLHFDASWHDIRDQAALGTAVRREAQILQDLLNGTEVRCFSFHNTTNFTMSARADSYGGLWNAYSGRLQDEVEYVSDSNGYWRFRSWAELLFEAPPRIQVLTHPEWWTESDLPPAEKVCRLLEDRSRETWRDYVSLLQRAGRSIVSAVPETQSTLLDGLGELELMRLWLSGDYEAAYFKIVRLLAQEDHEASCPAAGQYHLDLLERLLRGDAIESAELSEAFNTATLSLKELRQSAAAAKAE